MKRLIVLLWLISAVIFAILTLASRSIAQVDKYPVFVKVSFNDGNPLPEMEDKLIEAVSQLGYMIKSDALISVEGLLSVASERQISGIGNRSMLDLQLDIQFRDTETGDVLKALSINGRGLGDTREKAIQNGIRQIKIDTPKLSEALESCYADYLRIKERRYLMSKQYFEEGERLFSEKRYREAINALKGVYPETEFFTPAQRLIQDICMVMPKPVIAVLKFKTNSSGVADNFRDMLTTTLVQMEGDIIVLEREQILEILGEQKLELDGLIDPATASEFGMLIGAGFMTLGSLNVSGNQVEIDARIVKVKTGEIVISSHKKASTDQLDTIAKDIASEIYQGIESGRFDEYIPPSAIPSSDVKKPRVMIMIPEVHIHRPIPDPAGETEMIRKFLQNGFKVVDQAQVKKIRDTREAKAAIKGDLDAAKAIARQYGAEVIIVGEAFSENIPRRPQEMQTCSARVEARAIYADTGLILAANGKEAHAADVTEGVAAKKALRKAGGLLADDMIAQISEARKSHEGTYDIELFVRNIEYQQLIMLEGILKGRETITEVQRRSYDDSVAVIEIKSEDSAQNLADTLAASKFDGFKINIDTVSGNNIEISVK